MKRNGVYRSSSSSSSSSPPSFLSFSPSILFSVFRQDAPISELKRSVHSTFRWAMTWRNIIMESVNENVIFAKGNEKAHGLSSSIGVSSARGDYFYSCTQLFIVQRIIRSITSYASFSHCEIIACVVYLRLYSQGYLERLKSTQ